MAELRRQLLLVIKLLMLMYGPLLLFVAVLSIVAPFVEQVTPLQAIAFPVIACVMVIMIVGVILRLPATMHPVWFFAACVVHMFMGITSIDNADTYARVLMAILFGASFWELHVATRRFRTVSSGPS